MISIIVRDCTKLGVLILYTYIPDDKADAPKDDDVIDADFEEVDDDKKASGQ